VSPVIDSSAKSRGGDAAPPVAQGVAVLLGPLAVDGQVDGGVELDESFLVVEPGVAVADPVFGSESKALGARTVGSHRPDVEFVVEQDRLVVLAPAGVPEGRLLHHGVVVGVIDEVGRHALGDIDVRAAGQVVGVVMIVLEIEQVRPARAGVEEVLEPLLDEGLAPGIECDHIDVAAIGAEHGLYFIRRGIGPVGQVGASDRESVFDHLVGQLHEGIGADVPDRQEVLGPVGVGPQFLLGHDRGVTGVPDLDVGGIVALFGTAGARRGFGGVLPGLLGLGRFRFPLLDAEEEHRAVLGPRETPVVDDPHPLGEGVDRAVIEELHLGAAFEAGPDDQVMGRILVSVVLAFAPHRQVVGLLAPRQVGIRRFRADQGSQGPGLGIEELNPVAGPAFGIDDEGEQSPFVLPGVVGNVAEVGVPAGSQLTQHQIDTAAFTALDSVATHRQPGAVVPEGKRGHFFDDRFLARFEIEEPELVVQRLPGLPPPLTLIGRIADRESEPLSVSREGRTRTEGYDVNAVGFERMEVEFILLVDPVEGVAHPGTIGREGGGISERFPLAVVFGGQGRFLLALSRQGNRSEQGENGDAGCEWAAHEGLSLHVIRYIV